MSTESEIDAFIASLTGPELDRVLAILEYGEHKCHGARVGCCGTFRCEPCHIIHLRSVHGIRAMQFWNKLCQESRLTWPDSKPPLPVSHPRKSRPRKEVNDPQRYIPVPSIESLLAEAELKLSRLKGNA